MSTTEDLVNQYSMGRSQRKNRTTRRAPARPQSQDPFIQQSVPQYQPSNQNYPNQPQYGGSYGPQAPPQFIPPPTTGFQPGYQTQQDNFIPTPPGWKNQAEPNPLIEQIKQLEATNAALNGVVQKQKQQIQDLEQKMFLFLEKVSQIEASQSQQ